MSVVTRISRDLDPGVKHSHKCIPWCPGGPSRSALALYVDQTEVAGPLICPGTVALIIRSSTSAACSTDKACPVSHPLVSGVTRVRAPAASHHNNAPDAGRCRTVSSSSKPWCRRGDALSCLCSIHTSATFTLPGASGGTGSCKKRPAQIAARLPLRCPPAASIPPTCPCGCGPGSPLNRMGGACKLRCGVCGARPLSYTLSRSTAKSRLCMRSACGVTDGRVGGAGRFHPD